MRGKAATAAAAVPPAIVPAPRLAPTEASRRWAKALRRRCSSRALRSTPSRVRRAAGPCGDHRVHHPGRSDRPDPRAPPHPRRDGDPRRRAESALDPRTVWIGPHATTRRGPRGPLRLTPTPRPREGTFGVRVRPTGASDRSPRRPGAHGNRRPGGHRGAAAGGDQAAARRPALAGSAIAPYVHWILDQARLNFLSWDEMVAGLIVLQNGAVRLERYALAYSATGGGPHSRSPSR